MFNIIHKRINYYFIINFISVLLFYFSEFSIIAILPLFVTDYLHFDVSQVGLFAGAFSLAAMAIKLVSGSAADKFGKLLLYKVSLLLSGVAVFFYSKVSGFSLLFMTIFIHGLFSGVFRSLFLSVTASIIEKRNLGIAIGVIGVAIMLSMMFGSVFSVAFINFVSYSALFNLLTIFYIIAASLVFFIKLKEGEHKIIPNWKLFIEKKVVPIALLKFSGAVCYGLFLSYGVIYARDIGVFNAGAVITAYAASNIIMRPIYGYLLDRFRLPFPLLIPYIILFTGYFIFSQMNILSVLVGASIIGIGSAIEYTTIGYTAFKKVDEDGFNRASSTIELFLSLGITVSSFASSRLLTDNLSDVFHFAAYICIIPIISVSVYYIRKR